VRVAESPELRLAQKRNSEIFNLTAATFNTGKAPAFRVLTAALR